jgi:aspartate carbamoyltransferase catalytic subunit
VYVHAVDETNVARRDFEEAMRDLQPDTMILNPGAQSEEFRENVNDSPFNAYFEQIRGALFIHMALMRSILVEKPLK